jgi:hypothetical protein
LIALERELAELAAVGVEEALRVKDFSNGLLGGFENNAGAQVEHLDAGLDARVEEDNGEEELVLFGECALVICLLRSDE